MSDMNVEHGSIRLLRTIAYGVMVMAVAYLLALGMASVLLLSLALFGYEVMPRAEPVVEAALRLSALAIIFAVLLPKIGEPRRKAFWILVPLVTPFVAWPWTWRLAGRGRGPVVWRGLRVALPRSWRCGRPVLSITAALLLLGVLVYGTRFQYVSSTRRVNRWTGRVEVLTCVYSENSSSSTARGLAFPITDNSRDLRICAAESGMLRWQSLQLSR